MKYMPMLLAALILSACGDSGREDEEKPKGGVIGEAYVESLEEAEAVDDLVKDHGDRLAEEIEASENPN